MTEGQRLNEIVGNVYRSFDEQGQVPIDPAFIADAAYVKIDPDDDAPMLVKAAATSDLRQRARIFCATTQRDLEKQVEQNSDQDSLFDFHLQKRYPATREGRDLYVPREQLTLEERQENISRLRKESQSKSTHADALEAETKALLAAGALPELVEA